MSVKFNIRGFLILGLLFACISTVGPVAWSQQTEQTATLEVIGRGRVYRDDAAKARNEAIADGLRNAVEQAVGLVIPSVSVIDNFQLLNDEVYSKADEVIHDYKVLAEAQSGPYYRLVIRATLLTGPLQSKLQDMGILTMGRGMPSVVLLLSEQNIGEISPRCSWDGSPFSDLPLTVEKTLSRYMREKGFFIVNQATAPISGKDLGLQCEGAKVSEEAAIKLAKQLNAEVVIIGQGSARFSGNVSGTGMKSVEAALSVRAITADDGIVIGASERTRASVHGNEMTAGTEALGLAASDAAEDLSKKIVANWDKEAGQPVLVELVVKGIEEYGDFVKLRTALRNEIRGVQDVYLKAIRAGEAKMDLDIKGNTRMLADELMLKSFEGFGVHILEVNQGGITLEIIGKDKIPDHQDDQDVPGELEAPQDGWDLYRHDDVRTYPAH